MIDCKHWQRADLTVGGHCALLGATVSPGVCGACKLREPGSNRAPAPAPKPAQPVPRERWPAWARALALMSVPEDKGIGSTAERLAGKAGIAFKAWVKSQGFDCGCSARRELWDQQYPFC